MVRQSTSKTYGGVYFGFDTVNAQGGVNEKGLVFDYNALPAVKLNKHTELPPRCAIMNRIQQSCATVEEAIAIAKNYDWGGTLSYQINMADVTGYAVVVSALILKVVWGILYIHKFMILRTEIYISIFGINIMRL